MNITGSGYTKPLNLLAYAITEKNANVPVSAIDKVIEDMMKEDELATGPQGTIVINSLNQNSGPVGIQITIHEYNFTGREEINIGNVPLYATPSYVSPDGIRLIFTMPSSTERFLGNSYPVTLTTPNGGSIQ